MLWSYHHHWFNRLEMGGLYAVAATASTYYYGGGGRISAKRSKIFPFYSEIFKFGLILNIWFFFGGEQFFWRGCPMPRLWCRHCVYVGNVCKWGCPCVEVCLGNFMRITSIHREDRWDLSKEHILYKIHFATECHACFAWCHMPWTPRTSTWDSGVAFRSPR